MYTYTRRVNYYETDKMGVVHHSNYIRYFEEARTCFMEAAGWPYPRLEAEGIMSPVLAVSCEYKMPVRYPEVISVETRLVSMSKFRCSFRYEVRGADGTLRATGASEHCYLSESGTIVNIQKTDPDFYNAFLPLAEEEGPRKRPHQIQKEE